VSEQRLDSERLEGDDAAVPARARKASADGEDAPAARMPSTACNDEPPKQISELDVARRKTACSQ
jgi:hypothetical protein